MPVGLGPDGVPDPRRQGHNGGQYLDLVHRPADVYRAWTDHVGITRPNVDAVFGQCTFVVAERSVLGVVEVVMPPLSCGHGEGDRNLLAVVRCVLGEGIEQVLVDDDEAGATHVHAHVVKTTGPPRGDGVDLVSGLLGERVRGDLPAVGAGQRIVRFR